MRKILGLLLLSTTLHAATPLRVVTVGGAVTETAFALGSGDVLVGVDTSSTFPEMARTLPQVGYQRALSAEGIASLRPDLVIVSANAGPPTALAHLAALKIPVLRLVAGDSLDGATTRVLQMGEALGREGEATKLVEKIASEVGARVPLAAHSPRVLFVMSLGQGSPMVAGRETAAAAMLELVGAQNAGNAIQGYKQFSREALVLLDPEIVVTTSRTLAANGGEANLAKLLPGLEITAAGRSGRLIVMDDLFLLGFGPRIGEAAQELATKLNEPSRRAER